MDHALATERMTAEQNQRISEVVERERPRLRNFIRKHVPDGGDVEDLLQEVFYELVETYRLMKPVEQVGAWLFRVARNRMTDLFRRRKRESFAGGLATVTSDGEVLQWADLLPSSEPGPEALYARRVLREELHAALDELPDEQRDVFIAHEIQGRSFKELAAETGLSVNTLLSRKHYAVRHLRQRLHAIYAEFSTRWGNQR